MGDLANKDIYLGLGWFLVWVLFGTFSLFAHNLVLPYVFFVCAFITYAAHLYISCTRCCYFGKSCYLLGGSIAPSFFKERKPGPMDPDDAVSQAMWAALGIFPAPFLLYYQDWFLLALYSALTIGWFYYRKAFFCAKCESGWCKGKNK